MRRIKLTEKFSLKHLIFFTCSTEDISTSVVFLFQVFYIVFFTTFLHRFPYLAGAGYQRLHRFLHRFPYLPGAGYQRLCRLLAPRLAPRGHHPCRGAHPPTGRLQVGGLVLECRLPVGRVWGID